MTHQILSLKWRPRTFSEVVGQDHIMHTLINAFKSNIVAHAYMFTGPRGVGKTTTARIVAKALNCQNNPGTGCTECTNCHEISEARNLDVLEIDGASNRGIDEIRNIRELIKFPPMNSPNKVIIIDEVHMLTTPAFNALLRTLEEPPPHGKFILATTDIQKVPMTIISRCQRFDFYRLSSKIILDQMIKILQSESIQADKESLQAIAVKSTGSMRDALSTLEQVIAYSEDKIRYKNTVKVLGLIPVEIYFRIMKYLNKKDTNSMVNELKEIQTSGTPPSDFINGLDEHIRNLLIASQKGGINLLEVNEELKNQYQTETKDWDIRDLLRISDILEDLSVQLKQATQPDILIEMAFFKLLEMDSSLHLDELIQRINSSDLSGNQKKINTEIVKEKTNTAKPTYEVEEPEKTETSSNIKVKHEISEPESPSVLIEGQTEKSKVDENQNYEEISDSESAEETTKPEPNGQAELTLEFIQSKWTDFVHYVSSHKPSVGTILESCMAQNIDKKELHVSLFEQPKFNFSVLERNKRWISHSLEQIISHPVSIKFIFEEKQNKSGNNTKNKSNKNLLHKNGKAIISQIIDVFDGEIIN